MRGPLQRTTVTGRGCVAEEGCAGESSEVYNCLAHRDLAIGRVCADLETLIFPPPAPTQRKARSEEARQGGGRETTTLTGEAMVSTTPAPATHPVDNPPGEPPASNDDPGKGADGAVEGPAMEAVKLALQLADKATLPPQPRGKPQWNPDILTSVLHSQNPPRCTTMLRRDDPDSMRPCRDHHHHRPSSSHPLLSCRLQISLCPCQPRSIWSMMAPLDDSTKRQKMAQNDAISRMNHDLHLLCKSSHLHRKAREPRPSLDTHPLVFSQSIYRRIHKAPKRESSSLNISVSNRRASRRVIKAELPPLCPEHHILLHKAPAGKTPSPKKNTPDPQHQISTPGTDSTMPSYRCLRAARREGGDPWPLSCRKKLSTYVTRNFCA